MLVLPCALRAWPSDIRLAVRAAERRRKARDHDDRRELAHARTPPRPAMLHSFDERDRSSARARRRRQVHDRGARGRRRDGRGLSRPPHRARHRDRTQDHAAGHREGHDVQGALLPRGEGREPARPSELGARARLRRRVRRPRVHRDGVPPRPRSARGPARRVAVLGRAHRRHPRADARGRLRRARARHRAPRPQAREHHGVRRRTRTTARGPTT